MSGAEIEWTPDAQGALDGMRVLDLSRLVAGNAVTHVLADHGAEVIKVEKPGTGDDLRNWKTEGVATHWKVYCRNKKSVTLNWRAEGATELFLDLAATARVLVENFKPGTLEAMGIGPEVLHARNPDLVIVRISGWGQDGMWAHKPGFGSLVEAMSGFAAMNGFDDRPPVLPPLALADMIAGLYGAFAVMVAVREMELKGGPGQVIDLPLFDPIHSVLGPIVANYELTKKVPERKGSLSNQTAPRNVYRCKDGKYVALSGSMQAMAERLFRAMGRPDLIDDPRFRTNTDRVANNDQLDPIVGAFMAERTRDECLALFEEAGVTVGAVADVAQIAEHPYPRDRKVLVSLPDEQAGRLTMHNVIPRLSRTPGHLRRPAPELGEHNDDIWRALGRDPAVLSEQGVI
ncbi:MAG: CoA transferase [Alphaproteobacteria bacterium]|nr:CoA transferase [Alphaproteobacteria bacterium]